MPSREEISVLSILREILTLINGCLSVPKYQRGHIDPLVDYVLSNGSPELVSRLSHFAQEKRLTSEQTITSRKRKRLDERTSRRVVQKTTVSENLPQQSKNFLEVASVDQIKDCYRQFYVAM
jgi:hypothetical protein